MYAVIAQGGKQYRVSPGDVVRLERMDAAPGDSVELTDVRMVAGEGELTVGSDASTKKVVGTLVRHSRGPKVIIFKKKRRKQYRRTRGHRQNLSEVRIERIE